MHTFQLLSEAWNITRATPPLSPATGTIEVVWDVSSLEISSWLFNSYAHMLVCDFNMNQNHYQPTTQHVEIHYQRTT